MESVLFYGAPQGCSFGSIVALEWLGRPYRLCRIEMLETPWDPLYAQVNPLFKTPALLTEEGDLLTESLAIVLHLAGRDAGSDLSPPQGTPAFDRLTRMLAYLNTDFFSAFAPLWKLYETEGLNDAEQELLRKLGRENVNKGCAHLDALLAGREWLLGDDRPSLADAYVSGIGRWVEYHRVLETAHDYPNLARYLGRLRNDPAVGFAESIERGEAATGGGLFQGHVTLQQLRSRLAA